MDFKSFKKTFKLICNECGEFAHTNTEYCEKCGAKALRSATKEDYEKHEKIATVYHKKTKKKHTETKKDAYKAKQDAYNVKQDADKATKEAIKDKKKAEKAEKKAM